MPRVLIISYYWPPAGGPGVQRLLKFAKYLPQFGWQPVILTVKQGNFPAYDQSLLKEIPSDLQVIKTANYEPDIIYKKLTGSEKDNIPVAVLAQKNLNWRKQLSHWIRLNLFVPDAKIGWIAPGVKASERLIRTRGIDLIYSSSPPPTVHLIAQKLKEKYDIPWVADFRDPWTKIHYYRNAKRMKAAKSIDKRLEKKALMTCDAVTTASSLFQKLLPIPDDKKTLTITNGFDDEVENIQPEISDKFTLVHMGGITSNRFYQEFFSGLNDFIADPEIKANTQLLLIGKVNSEIIAKIKALIGSEILSLPGYLPHQEALAKIKGAAVNLVFLEKLADYKGHIPGKIFEYIAVRKQIIGAGDPAGDTAEIIAKSGCGYVYKADSDWQQILKKTYKNWQQNKIPEADDQYISQFHRSNLTAKLAELFDGVI